MKNRTICSSVKSALRGLKNICVQERNFRIQLVVAALIIVLMLLLPLASWERILLIILIAGVLVLEVLNTAIERVSDLLKPRLNSVVRDVKDMMAGAVLLMSITASIVAIMIFWAYIVDLFTGYFPVIATFGIL